MPSSGVQTCARSEEHTSELQSHDNLVCRLLLEKKHNSADQRLRRAPPRTNRITQPTSALARCGQAAAEVLVSVLGRRGCGLDHFCFFLMKGGPPDVFVFPLPDPFPI